MLTLILFLIILGLIVFIHELGHFLLAKKNGIYVYEFSIGFGPKLFSFKRKNDETEYMIKLIPLGGYVALAGEEVEEEKDTSNLSKEEIEELEKNKIPEDKKLYNKGFLSQFTVMVAGVFNNFVLGILLLFILGLCYGSTFTTNELDNLNKNYPLYKAGARDGDKVIAINNKKVKNFDDIQTRIAISGGKNKLDIKVLDKNNNEKNYKVKPKYDKKSKSYYYGISIKIDKGTNFLDNIKYAFSKFVSIYKSLVIIIISLFTGKLGMDSLSGPVGIYTVVGVAKSSLYSLIYLTAYLSINVGFMNLLPFPAFDGGRAFLLVIEKITGKKVPLKVETIINEIGFILLMILMVFVTIKDILRLI